jgi:hypothetical protein
MSSSPKRKELLKYGAADKLESYPKPIVRFNEITGEFKDT